MIRNDLLKLKDTTYKKFEEKLIPNIDKEKIIGIKTPVIKEYLKTLTDKEEINNFLNNLPHYYLEENNLHAFIIATKKTDINTTLELTNKFLPYIDNWATCDSFNPSNFKKNKDKLYIEIKKWLKSEHPYTVRFAVVNLMRYYLDENFNETIFTIINKIKLKNYYVDMAIAWFYSVALIKQYDATIKIIEQRQLKQPIHNKSIQKAIESLRIDNQKKEYLKSLRIKP